MAALVISTTAVHAQQEAESTQENGNPQVTIHTNRGDIRLELYPDEAPVSVANFLQYANDGFYDGTIFHRVIDNFMIQGGGFTADYQKKTTRASIQNEADNGLSNARGTLAMAKVGGDPDSATSQWFINLADNFANLDVTNGGYTVFGDVLNIGMVVVDSIASLPIYNRTDIHSAFGELPLIDFVTDPIENNNLVKINSSKDYAVVIYQPQQFLHCRSRCCGAF